MSNGRYMSNLKHALDFLSKFPDAKLFPAEYKDSSHRGLIKWGAGSSNDPEQIKTWAKKFPGCYFCCNYRVSGLRVIDIDMKKGKNGAAEIMALELANEDLPHTLTVATPSGNGRHLYFVGECAFSLGKIGSLEPGKRSGIDIPGMTPVPGSVVPGKGEYKILEEAPAAQIPTWWVDVAGTFQPRQVNQETGSLVELDMEHNVEKAVWYLKEQAPEAIEGNNGDFAAYCVACKVRDFGLSLEKASEILHEHYTTKCTPPDLGWLEEKVTNAYNYAQNAMIGVDATKDSPEEAFKDIEFPRELGPVRASALSIMDTPPREWLLGKRYISKFVTATVSPGGGSKSTLIMQEALSIATGKNICGEEIKVVAPVWISNNEDPLDEVQRRLAAICMHHKLDPIEDTKNVFLSGKELQEDMRVKLGIEQFSLRFAEPGDGGKFVENKTAISFYERFIRENGIKLWVLDPFVSCHGFPEGDNTNVDRVMKIITGICDRTNSACSAAGHTPKGVNVSGNADAWRGGGAMRDAARIMDTFAVMEEKECDKYGIPKTMRSWYVKRESAKANMRPPGEDLKWFKRVSVLLLNGKDNVGVLEPIELDLVETIPAEDTFISQVIFSMMNDGDSRTVNSISMTILEERGEELGKLMGSVPSKGFLNDKIEKLFATPQRDEENLEIRFVNKRLGTSKASKYLTAKLVENEG